MHVDFGQDSTQLYLRCFNVDSQFVRSVLNLDLVIIFDAPETYNNLKNTCLPVLQN